MYYLILFGALLVFLGVIALSHFVFNRREKLLIERILPFILIALVVGRTICYNDNMLSPSLIDYINNPNKPFNNFLGITSTILIWLHVTALVILLCRPFFEIKMVKHLTKFVALPIFILNAGFLSTILPMMCGTSDMSALYCILPIEIGLEIALGIYFFIKDFKLKISIKEIGIMLGLFIIMDIASMPPYAIQVLFPPVTSLVVINDITFEHRIFIYIFCVIMPITIYFSLRNKHPDVIRFAMIYISCATLMGFMTYYRYDVLISPWRWPIHLCNTAMFLMPICFIFKTKRLFYFTYFINVLGAFIAMMMPNYAGGTLATSAVLIHFWYNHAIAFFMPILGVALKLFDRPKLKQYGYSIIGFFGYFILALSLNVIFTTLGEKGILNITSEVDFFFINSDYVADKLGEWAERIYRMELIANFNDYSFTFHPLYQTLFFLVYIIIGLGVWFIYELFFSISESHYDLMLRLRKIKVDKIALLSKLNGRSLDEPMTKDTGIKYELKHFSKRYGASKDYAVKDANLEVHGGEIFGFLGPNGAGKSTIIKSTVGIQTITDGSIEICGFDCKTQPVQSKSLIGFVPDHYALYEKLTGREYLNYIADIYEVSKEDRDARLKKYVELFQLEAAIDNKIKTYSHGMKQKITIMSALIHNPKVWILDEPLTGLDPTSIFQVKECMKQHAREGNIVFFSSHIIDIVEKLCDRIAIIQKGDIKTVCSVKSIEDSGSTLEQFYLKTIGESLEENKAIGEALVESK